MIPIFYLQKIFKLLALGGALLLLSGNVNAGFFDTHASGWHWYEQAEKEKKIKEERELTSLPPLEAIGFIKQDLKIKRAKAVLDPTEENVYDYIKTQEKWATQAEHFSTMWQRVLTKYPELDYSLEHPTSELAKRIEQEKRQKHIMKAMDFIRQKYGLFYFYRSNCAFCEKFSPILLEFTKRYQLSILPISIDGEANELFKHFKRDNGISEQWGVSHVPALFAVSPQSKEIIPIAFGLISQMELEQRFLMLAEMNQEKMGEAPLAVHYQH